MNIPMFDITVAANKTTAAKTRIHLLFRISEQCFENSICPSMMRPHHLRVVCRRPAEKQPLTT
jgi:hypothetical protein